MKEGFGLTYVRIEVKFWVGSLHRIVLFQKSEWAYLARRAHLAQGWAQLEFLIMLCGED